MLGHGSSTNADSAVPVDAFGVSEVVKSITGGGFFTCFLLGSGGVKCTGNISPGLGDGSTSSSLSPVDVSGLTSGVSAISGGRIGGTTSASVCALLSTGSVKCWGANTYGQLGDGTTTGSSVPVEVLGL